MSTDRISINQEIRARELRVIGAAGENLGVLSLDAALSAAKAAGLDLIEISPSAVPPVAKIADYGRFEYERSKKERAVKAKVKISETKEVQIKVGTGDNDMMLKAKKAAEWLAEGHRVRAELFLKGRYKGMDAEFLKERLAKFLAPSRTPTASRSQSRRARRASRASSSGTKLLRPNARKKQKSKPHHDQNQQIIHKASARH